MWEPIEGENTMEKPYYNSILDKYFDVLGVSKDITYEELKKAYRKLAFIYHPDKNLDSKESERKMQQINEAYEILKSDDSRKRYVSSHPLYSTLQTQSSIDAPKENQTPSKSYFAKLKEEYIESYKSVRKDEKNYTIKDRFKKIYSKFEDEDYFGTFNSIIAQEGLKITCFIGLEFLYQLAKLKKEVNDTITKYTVRNRKTLAGLLIGFMLFNPLTTEAKSEKQDIQNTDYKTSQSSLILTSQYRLTRTYTVKPNDTLSSVASKFNVSEDQIIAANNLLTTTLKENKVLKIPYYIAKDELEYYTTSVNSSDYKSLEELAEYYETDLRTIYSLNVECFELIDGKYYQISDNLLIPTFPTSEEVAELKGLKTYQKS